MAACKIIGLMLSIAGAIIAIAGLVQMKAWAAGGGGLILLGRLVSEKIPEWFNLD